MTGDATDLDDLQRKCTDFAAAFPDDVDTVEFFSADVHELT